MKKLLYISSIAVLSLVFYNTTFAYIYSNTTTYSSEQFRKDINLYLSKQSQRQQELDWKEQDREFINSLYSRYNSINRQFDIQQMQQQLDNSRRQYDATSEQSKQVLEIVNQQTQLLIEQKYLREERLKEYEAEAEAWAVQYNHNSSVCKEVEAKYPQGVIQSLVDNCAKYRVYLNVEVTPPAVKVNTTKVQRPVFLDKYDEQVEPQRLDIFSEKPASATSTASVQTETVDRKPFYQRTFEKIKSFFSWF